MATDTLSFSQVFSRLALENSNTMAKQILPQPQPLVALGLC